MAPLLRERQGIWCFSVFRFQSVFLLSYWEHLLCPRFVFTALSRRLCWASGWIQRWTFLLKQPFLYWQNCVTGRTGTHIISNDTHTPLVSLTLVSVLTVANIWLLPVEGLINEHFLVSVIVDMFICKVWNSTKHGLSLVHARVLLDWSQSPNFFLWWF